jgi:hypothetical protein
MEQKARQEAAEEEKTISDDDMFFLITALQSEGITDMRTLSEWVKRRL